MPVTGCSPTTITPGVVVFSASEFLTQYPSFTTVATAALQQNFNLACLMLENSCCSVVQDAPTRLLLLYLATAHITALLNGVNGQPPQGVVGRITNAAEGSVNVQTEMLTQSESAAYWQQTPWGLAFWQATLQYRTSRYVPPGCASDFYGALAGWPL
jgi:hypothetical protein